MTKVNSSIVTSSHRPSTLESKYSTTWCQKTAPEVAGKQDNKILPHLVKS